MLPTPRAIDKIILTSIIEKSILNETFSIIFFLYYMFHEFKKL